MDRFDAARRDYLRAMNHELLRPSSPIPDDPVTSFPNKWSRASSSQKIDGMTRDGRADNVRIPNQRNRTIDNNIANMINAPINRDRPLSPSQIPGVRAIPQIYNHLLRGLLVPGEYFAKSQSRYLGPFSTEPTTESLPAGDSFIILQRMGRLPSNGKSIFRQIGNLNT